MNRTYLLLAATGLLALGAALVGLPPAPAPPASARALAAAPRGEHAPRPDPARRADLRGQVVQRRAARGPPRGLCPADGARGAAPPGAAHAGEPGAGHRPLRLHARPEALGCQARGAHTRAALGTRGSAGDRALRLGRARLPQRVRDR